MTPENKKRLRDAFHTAINNAPEPDAVIEGMADDKGQPLTFRQLMTNTAQSEQFYTMIDKAVTRGETTIDKVCDQISKTTRVRLQP